MDNKLFFDEPCNTGRQSEIDWARGLAVFFMIMVHVKIELSHFPLTDTYSKVIEFFGSPTAAPVFMILLGVGLVYSKNSTPQQLAARGIKLFILNYLLNFTAFVLPCLIMYAITGNIIYTERLLFDLLGTDILSFSGLTFLFFALMKKLNATRAHITIITLVLVCANFLLNVSADTILINAIFGIFVYGSDFSYFPFFPWIGYPVMGYIFGGLLIRCTEKKKLYRFVFPISALIVAAILLGTHKYHFNLWSAVVGDDSYYYQDFIQYILIGGIAFTWISLLSFLPEIKSGGFIGKTVMRWSRKVTTIYCAQWLIIGWLAAMKLFVFPAVPLYSFITGIIICILADASAHAYLVIKEKVKNLVLKAGST